MFVVGMWWRIAYGTLRILSGLVVVRLINIPLIDLVTRVMSHELIEDPNDLLFTLTTHVLTNHPISISYFLAVYLIFWGLIDIILSYNLIKHKLWAFPVSFVLIGAFVLYEMVRMSHTHSLILLSVILVDIFILWLTWREYVRVKTS